MVVISCMLVLALRGARVILQACCKRVSSRGVSCVGGQPWRVCLLPCDRRALESLGARVEVGVARTRPTLGSVAPMRKVDIAPWRRTSAVDLRPHAHATRQPRLAVDKGSMPVLAGPFP